MNSNNNAKRGLGSITSKVAMSIKYLKNPLTFAVVLDSKSAKSTKICIIFAKLQKCSKLIEKIKVMIKLSPPTTLLTPLIA